MNTTTRLIVNIVGGLLLVAAASFYLVRPSLKEVAKLNDQLAEKKTEAKTLEQQILAYKSAQSDLSKATEQQRIFDAVVDREGLVDPIIIIESAAAKTLTTHQLNIKEAQSAGKLADLNQRGAAPVQQEVIPGKVGVTEVPFTISVKNDFVGLLNFLGLLEHSPYITELVELEFAAETVKAENSDIAIPTGAVLGELNGIFFIKSNEKIVE
jgi:hypothetical protein